MRILLVNPAYEAGLQPAALLDRYDTLTGWCDALLEAGASQVAVLQRYSVNCDLERGGVRYRFRSDGSGPWPRPWTRPSFLLEAARSTPADVVHANGLVFPTFLGQLRRAVPGPTPMVVQDHGGGPPRAGVLGVLRRALWRRGVAGVDAIFFTAEEQARPWRSAGILTSRHAIHAVPEASRRVRRVAREEARRRSGVHGEPALLWVGRLVPTKDPLTVLEGFARVLPRLPQARLTYVYQDAALVEELRARLEAHAELRARVRLAGTLDRTALADCLSAADIFVLGSHAEGSGYALIEALACGLVPVVTDIPSFRALTDRGRLGALWPPGDAGALAEAVVGVAERSMEERRAAILRYFEAELSWPAVGRRALEAYRSARETRRA